MRRLTITVDVEIENGPGGGGLQTGFSSYQDRRNRLTDGVQRALTETALKSLGEHNSYVVSYQIRSEWDRKEVVAV